MPTAVYDSSLVTHYKVARTLYAFKKGRAANTVIPEQGGDVSQETVLQRTQGAGQIYRDGKGLFGGCACSTNTLPTGGM
jgi:hypothetical protein